jgi:hypothetical protein
VTARGLKHRLREQQYHPSHTTALGRPVTTPSLARRACRRKRHVAVAGGDIEHFATRVKIERFT